MGSLSSVPVHSSIGWRASFIFWVLNASLQAVGLLLLDGWRREHSASAELFLIPFIPSLAYAFVVGWTLYSRRNQWSNVRTALSCAAGLCATLVVVLFIQVPGYI